MSRFWQGKSRRQKIIFSAALLLSVAGFIFLLHAQPSLAAGSAGNAPTDAPLSYSGVKNIVSWFLLQISSLFLSITLFLLTFVIEIAGYNGFLSSTAVQTGWVMVRDITNMGFVVILLVIAFGTILGLEQYEWKKMLVKFVVAAILVNFSRLICGVLIDIGQVVMITFVNGVSATAGGNLLQAFNLDHIRSFAAQNGTTIDAGGIFLATVAAVIFSAIVMFMMGVFMFMLLARMIVLWVLIVLSPLAFVLSVIPQTEKYASQWWSEFGSNVITGPILLFFIWLSFVTVGSGTINNEINNNSVAPMNADATASQEQQLAPASSGVTDAMGWNSMANFAIGIGMLMVGARVASELGGVGGAWAGKAVDFGKKVGTIASGVALGRWVSRGVGRGAAKAVKGAAYNAPLVGGKKWVQRAGIIGQAMKGWYHGKGVEVTAEGRKTAEELKRLEEEKHEGTAEGQAELTQKIEAEEKAKAALDAEAKKEGLSEEQKTQLQEQAQKKQETIDQLSEKRKAGMLQTEQEKKQRDEEIAEKQKALKGQMGGGVIGFFARSGMELEKQLKKTQAQAENREKLLSKRVGSEAGGAIFSIPRFLPKIGGINLLSMGMNTGGLFGTGLFGDNLSYDEKGQKISALDRIEAGELQGEEARAKAKDEEYHNIGRMKVLGMPRLKFDIHTGKYSYQFGLGSMADQTEGHKLRAETYEAQIHHLHEHSREHLFDQATRRIEQITASEDMVGLKKKADDIDKDLMGLRKVLTDVKNLEAAQKRLEQRSELLRKRSVEEGKSVDELDRETEGDNLAKLQSIIAGNRTTLEEGKKDKKFGQYYTDFSDKDSKGIRGTVAEREKDYSDAQRNVADKIREKLESEIEVKDAETGKMKREKIIKSIPAWEYARHTAEKDHHDLFFKGKQRKMIDDAAQMHIWNARGIKIPNNAQMEIIEQVGKDFRAMNYEAAVAAIEGHMEKMQKWQEDHAGEEVPFEDFAISSALLQKLEEGKWIDDAIIPFRKVSEKFARVFGDRGQRFVGDLEERRSKSSGGSEGGGGGVGINTEAQARRFGQTVGQFLGGQQGGLKELFSSIVRGDAESIRSLQGALVNNVNQIGEIDAALKREFGLSGTTQQMITQLIGKIQSMTDTEKKLIRDQL